MTTAELQNEEIWVDTTYRDRALIRMVPGMRYDPPSQKWHGPLSWGTCKVLRGVFRDHLEVGPNLNVWAWNEFQTRVQPCLQLREVLAFQGDDQPFAFQRPGIEFLLRAERALLADEMGTGKTVQIVQLMRRLVESGQDPFPLLVICPNSLKFTWAREFAKWFPEADVQLISGTPLKRRAALKSVKHVAIVNWEALRLHSRLAPYGSIRLTDNESKPKELNAVPWRSIVADEAHHMKNPHAKQTRAAWWLAHHGPRFIYALTGTPVANAPDDAWSILHFIAPEDWPARTRYIDRYCLQSWNLWGGTDVIGLRPETQDEFFGILDPRMRRMPKDLVLPYLPPREPQARLVELPKKQLEAYGSIKERMLADLDSGLLLATNPLVQLTRLIQFASAYATVDDEGQVRLSEPSGKIDELMEIAAELGSEPFVVFAESRQLIELACLRLEKARISFTKIVGGMSPHDRDRAQSDFQEGRVRAILLTLGAGGEGLTLTRAGYAVFLQRSWSALKNAQAMARVHRIGSEIHEKIFIIDIIAQGTVEEYQLQVLADKSDRLEEFLRDGEFLRRLLG